MMLNIWKTNFLKNLENCKEHRDFQIFKNSKHVFVKNIKFINRVAISERVEWFAPHSCPTLRQDASGPTYVHSPSKFSFRQKWEFPHFIFVWAIHMTRRHFLRNIKSKWFDNQNATLSAWNDVNFVAEKSDGFKNN